MALYEIYYTKLCPALSIKNGKNLRAGAKICRFALKKPLNRQKLAKAGSLQSRPFKKAHNFKYHLKQPECIHQPFKNALKTGSYWCYAPSYQHYWLITFVYKWYKKIFFAKNSNSRPGKQRAKI